MENICDNFLSHITGFSAKIWTKQISIYVIGGYWIVVNDYDTILIALFLVGLL
jgi:hypothetical protein